MFGPSRKSWSRNTTAKSDFRPEVEIRPFRAACTLKTMQYIGNPYFMAESPKFPRLNGNRRREHDGDVEFKSGSGNMAVSCMRNASGHNNRNSSFIVDLAMGHILYHIPLNVFLVQSAFTSRHPIFLLMKILASVYGRVF